MKKHRLQHRDWVAINNEHCGIPQIYDAFSLLSFAALWAAKSGADHFQLLTTVGGAAQTVLFAEGDVPRAKKGFQ